MRTRALKVVTLSVGLVLASGCSSSDGRYFSEDAPAEGTAEEKVYAGVVPKAADITVEGKLASTGRLSKPAYCESELCLSSEFAFFPEFASVSCSVFVQLDWVTNDFERQPQRPTATVSLLVDVSSSMVGEKIGAVNAAIYELLSHLSDSDRRRYGSLGSNASGFSEFEEHVDAEHFLGLTALPDSDDKINLRIALGAAAKDMDYLPVVENEQRFIILFADLDAQASAAEDSKLTASLEATVAENVTVLIFGLGQRPNLRFSKALVKYPNINYYHVPDYRSVVSVFDSGLDPWLSAVASDVKLELTPSDAYQLRKWYGLGWGSAEPRRFQFEQRSVYADRLSKTTLLELSPTDGCPTDTPEIATLSVSYTQTGDTSIVALDDSLVYDNNGASLKNVEYFSSDSIHQTMIWASAARSESEACRLYWEGHEKEAETTLETTKHRLEDAAARFENSKFGDEVEWVTELNDTIRQGGRRNRTIIADSYGPPGCQLTQMALANRRASLLIVGILSALIIVRRSCARWSARLSRSTDTKRLNVNLASVRQQFAALLFALLSGCTERSTNYRCECKASCSDTDEPFHWVDPCQSEIENVGIEDVVIGAESSCESAAERASCHFAECSCQCTEVALGICSG